MFEPRRLAHCAAAAMAVVMAMELISVPPASAEPPTVNCPTVADRRHPVKGRDLKVRPRKADPAARPGPPAKATWPARTSAEVDVPSASPSAVSAAAHEAARAGDLPIEVLAPIRKEGSRGGTEPAGRVRVQMLDRGTAHAVGVDGPAFTVARTDAATPGRVRLRLDYSEFEQAFGGAYGARLRLMRLPQCALTTPAKPKCHTPAPLKTTNDGETKSLTADVKVAPSAKSGSPAVAATQGNATLLVAAAGSESSQGDYKATSLKPSATWQAGGNGGSFSWSYPMRVPPVPGGLAPKVAISYSSASVDGRTANTSGQPSWIGEGFDLWPGYIERRYKSCEDDGVPKDQFGNAPGDQCWGYENATLSWGGRAGELIKASDGTWRLKSDDGTRFERLTESSLHNGDNNGEYWKVTTTDGIQYYFGLNRAPGWVSGKPETNSTWTAPVFGDDSGEPCHDSSGFKESWCHQAYRWNLDYVVDPAGNAILYTYGKEINHYGRNLEPEDETAYTRGGYLKTISYGLRKDDLFAKAPAQVTFTTSERCIPDAEFDCAPSRIDDEPDRWWDVPWDLNCDSGQECKEGHGSVAPTFWSRKRLTKVATQIITSDGSRYRQVDSWSLNHEWGLADVERDLLLHDIQHTGHVVTGEGKPVTLPKVTFNHVQMPNRLDESGDDILPYIRYRLGAIYDESGGQLEINYSDSDCSRSDLPDPETNTTRCMPVIWTPPGREEPITDWFHKYVVTSVTQVDRTGLSPNMTTKYEYVGDAAWHFDDDDGLTKKKEKTWSQWRGYGHVRTFTGDPADPATQTDTRYMRGMDGDRKTKSGGEKSVTVSDGEGGTYTDHDALAGFELKTVQYTEPGGNVHSKTVNTPWRAQTASRTRSWGTVTANATATDTTRTWTAKDGGGWHETKTDNTYVESGPGIGRATSVNSLGDVTTSADDECTRTTYADNTAAWMVSFPSRVETVSVACTAAADRPADVLSDLRTYYDNGDLGDGPTKANVTKTEKLAGYDGETPTYVTGAITAHDAYGRVTKVTDAAGQATTTTYTDTHGLNTKIVTTTPPATPGDPATALTTETHVEPAWGEVVTQVDRSNHGLRTDLEYDPLGRLAQVWLPNRSKFSAPHPNHEFDYRITDGEIVAVTTKTLTEDGDQRVAKIELLDGWLRPRQTQKPTHTAEAGESARLISDTFYDDRGQVVKTYAPYLATGAPETELFGVGTPGAVETQTRTAYDGLGRKTVERLTKGNGSQPDQELWRTTHSYGGGNRVSVTPPDGGTPTTEITDALGQVIERRRYEADTPSGDYNATTYTYTPTGEIASVTDPSGNVWTTTYDLRGRKIETTDPDKGTTTFTYDDLDRLVSTTDARGEELFTDYDGMGRKTAVHRGSRDGTPLVSWTYDTAGFGKGKLASSTRHTPDGDYTSSIRSYDSLGRAKVTSTTIPASEGPLAGTYALRTDYKLTGAVAGHRLPSAGGLPGEGITFAYDAYQRPTRMYTRASTYVNDVDYTQTNQTQLIELGAEGKHVWQTFQYEYGTQRLRTARVSREQVAGFARNAVYHYTDSGSITSITDTSGDGVDQQCFTYDHLQRLTRAWTQGTTGTCADEPNDALIGGPAPYWRTFTYDNAGNRAKETRHGIGGETDTVRTYTYADPGHGNRLDTVTHTGPTGDRTAAYGYDATGNTTAITTTGDSPATSTQSFDWNAEGELTKVTEDGKDVTFVYDAAGNRLIRKDPTGSTLYLPGGTELRALKGSGTATGTRYYAFAGQTVAMRTSDGKVTYLASDHAGSGQVAIDSDTQQATIRRFTPFGTVRGFDDDATWPGDKGFVGGTQDPTGLTHLGAREYDPETGRFISVDPLMDIVDPQQMNGYTYANNSPVTNADADGTMCYHTSNGLTDCYNGDGVIRSPNKGERGYTVYPDGVNGRAVRSGNSGGAPWAWSPPASKRPAPTVTCNGGLALHTGCSVGAPVPNYSDYRPGTTSTFEKIAGLAVIAAAICLFGGCELAAAAGRTATTACMLRIITCLRLAGIGTAGGNAVNEGNGGPAVTGGSGSALTGKAGLRKLMGLCSSFVPGTKVLMADGAKKDIEDIDAGDKVLATDPETGETTTEPVLATITSKGDKNLVQITINTDAPRRFSVTGNDPKHTTTKTATTKLSNSGVLIATDNHPFWVAGDINKWVQAADLKPGMWLRTSAGTYTQITATKTWTTHHQRVHNLTTANLHTYYVVGNSVPALVHNNNKCINWAPNSVKTWGHTFKLHGVGAKKTKKLVDRARSSGNDQGQWLDDDAAAEFLRGVHAPNAGPFSVRLPEGMGQVIRPDGSIIEAPYALIVPSRNGLFKTAYPYLGEP